MPPMAWTAGRRWRFRPCSRTTPSAASRRPRGCTRARSGPICSSRFPVPPRASPRSRNRSSRACRSTSRCCSPVSNTSRRRSPTCAASNGASRRASIRWSHRWHRCSSVAGTWPSRTACRRRFATASASPSRCAPTRPIATCWPRRAGTSSPPPARGRNACCGPVPVPRIRPLRQPFMLKRSRRRIPSTPFPKRRCRRSPRTARRPACCRWMRASPKPPSPSSSARASTMKRWPPTYSAKAPKPSRNPGAT